MPQHSVISMTKSRSELDVAGIINEARRKAGLTSTELALKSGVTLPGLRFIERGKGQPRLDTLMKLCAALNLEVKIKPKT